MNERVIDEIAEKVCEPVRYNVTQAIGYDKLLENVKAALTEERKQAAVEACRVICKHCANHAPAPSDYRCGSLELREHFNLFDADFQPHGEAEGAAIE